MADKYTIKTLNIGGMTCPVCETRIEGALKKLNGVIEAAANYAKGTVRVKYAADKTELSEIIRAIEKLHYTALPKKNAKQDRQRQEEKLDVKSFAAIGIIILAIYLIIKNTVGFNFIPSINQNMGFAMLFIAGLITSIHCLSMCGGINLSQSVGYNSRAGRQDRFDQLKPSLLYNAGRVTSYTACGAAAGAVGSVFMPSGAAMGFIAIVAAVFMLLMGLNMLNVFPALRNIAPRMPRFISAKIDSGKTGKGPLVVGLLNGFMPCGPLQAAQIYALGTGSAVTGALSMFFFSMGTVPLMFAFGAVSTFLSGKFTRRMMTASAVLVMALGLVMLNRGLGLFGAAPLDRITYSNAASGAVQSSQSYNSNIAQIRDGVQYVNAVFTARHYQPIVVQAGIPVDWTIDMRSINGCNNPFLIQKFRMQIRLAPGKNTVKFTPAEAGIIPYFCWMGMITSRIVVVEDLANLSPEEAAIGKS